MTIFSNSSSPPVAKTSSFPVFFNAPVVLDCSPPFPKLQVSARLVPFSPPPPIACSPAISQLSAPAPLQSPSCRSLLPNLTRSKELQGTISVWCSREEAIKGLSGERYMPDLKHEVAIVGRLQYPRERPVLLTPSSLPPDPDIRSLPKALRNLLLLHGIFRLVRSRVHLLPKQQLISIFAKIFMRVLIGINENPNSAL